MITLLMALIKHPLQKTTKFMRAKIIYEDLLVSYVIYGGHNPAIIS
jgi:hypothetical protein